MSASNRRGSGSRRSSSGISASPDSFATSIHKIGSVAISNHKLVVTYADGRASNIANLSQLRHNRVSYPARSPTGKRVWASAISEFTHKLSILQVLVLGGEDCINKLIKPSSPQIIIEGANGGLFRFAKSIRAIGVSRGYINTPGGTRQAFHVEGRQREPAGTRSVVNIPPNVEVWIYGHGTVTLPEDDLGCQFMTAKTQVHEFDRCELNTVAYVDAQHNVISRGPSYYCKSYRRLPSYCMREYVTCGKCLPELPMACMGIPMLNSVTDQDIETVDHKEVVAVSKNSVMDKLMRMKTQTFRVSSSISKLVKMVGGRKAEIIQVAPVVWPGKRFVDKTTAEDKGGLDRAACKRSQLVSDDWGNLVSRTEQLRGGIAVTITVVLLQPPTFLVRWAQNVASGMKSLADAASTSEQMTRWKKSLQG